MAILAPPARTRPELGWLARALGGAESTFVAFQRLEWRSDVVAALDIQGFLVINEWGSVKRPLRFDSQRKWTLLCKERWLQSEKQSPDIGRIR